MKRLGILFLAAGVAWMIIPVTTGMCATDSSKNRTGASVKAPTVNTPSKPTVKTPMVKTPAKPAAKAATGKSPTRASQPKVAPRSASAQKPAAVKAEDKYPATGGFYEGVKWDKKGHVPQGTYVGDDGRLHYYSKVTPYKPPPKTAPQTPTTVEGWPAARPSAVGEWQPGRPYEKPSGHSSTGSESLNWSTQQGGKRPASAKTSSAWSGAPPPNPAQGKSGTPYAKPGGRTSTSGEVLK